MQFMKKNKIINNNNSNNKKMLSDKFARERDLELNLMYPQSSCSKLRGDEVPRKQVKEALKKSVISKLKSEVEDQMREGKLVASR